MMETELLKLKIRQHSDPKRYAKLIESNKTSAWGIQT